MLKSWSIQNFKPILDSGELQLKPVTILAGRNSSGKSSLIQSILMIAQTLSNPLPERALLPNERIVQLGTYNDVLCKFSGSRAIAIGFELTDEPNYEDPIFSHYELNMKFIDISDNRSGNFASELSTIEVEHLYLRFVLGSYISSEELIGEVNAKRLTGETTLNFPNLASYVIKSPSYFGEFTLSENKIQTEEKYILELFHFLPFALLHKIKEPSKSIGTKNTTDVLKLMDEEEAFYSASNRLSEISQDITRFFTTKIRYLGPLRLDPDVTQRTFAPTSQLDEVGDKGEYAAVAYHYSQLARIDWYNLHTKQVEQGTLKDAMNSWVNYLGVASEITTEEAGTLGVAWKVVIKKGQETRTLPQVGGGMNHLLPILVMGLLSPKNTLLIIEEPEVTLHPSVQARLGDFFIGLAKCGKQCLIETHSENLVSQLRYHIVQAGGMEKSDCMIYFVDQDEQGATKFEKVEISAKGNILNWPDGFFDETMLQEGRITTASLRKRAKKANDG